jgi:hypothetical protein
MEGGSLAGPVERPVGELISELARFGWYTDHDRVILTRRDVSDILGCFIPGDLSSQEVEAWANTIECREDRGLEANETELVKQAVHELATPELEEPISIKLADRWTKQLSS